MSVVHDGGDGCHDRRHRRGPCLRLLGGVASAWAMIAVSSLVLAVAGTARRRTGDVMFAGVGAGIIVSTLVIAACAMRVGRSPNRCGSPSAWRAPPARWSPIASSVAVPSTPP